MAVPDEMSACRYCGIEPDQESPRPSYHEMRVERDEARTALAEVERALTLACDDAWYAWPDALAAKQYYLDLAAKQYAASPTRIE